MTERALRDRRWLPAPSWCDGRRALSGTLLPGAQAARQSWKAAPPSASFAPRPGPLHTTLTSWRPEGRHLLDDDHQPEEGTRSLNHHEAPRRQKDQDLASCPPLYPPVPTPRSSLFIAPPPPPLPAPAGSFQKRGVPSRLPPRPPRRGRGNHSWPRSKEIHSPKSGPHPT